MAEGRRAPAPPAVLVMADAPRPGEVRTALEPLLGPHGCAALEAALLRIAVGWGAMVAPGRVWVAFAPPDAEDDVRHVAGLSVRLLAQRGGDLGERLAAASADVFEAHDGPLLVIGTGLPTLRRHHAEAALDDLAAGCDVTFGRSGDGGYYLIGLDAPHPEVFALPGESWAGENVLMATMGLAHEAGLSMGMLRLETGLDTPSDARLLMVDRHLPRAIRELLDRDTRSAP
jgi:rSAM/selenodomain-associated transferase 1